MCAKVLKCVHFPSGLLRLQILTKASISPSPSATLETIIITDRQTFKLFGLVDVLIWLSGSSGWPQACFVARDDFEPLTLLSLAALYCFC